MIFDLILIKSFSYNRDWRYHKEERVWITRAQGIEPTRKTPTYEQGTYLYFDCKNWKKTPKVSKLFFQTSSTKFLNNFNWKHLLKVSMKQTLKHFVIFLQEFYLEYDKLEDRPQLPNLTALHYNPNQQG